MHVADGYSGRIATPSTSTARVDGPRRRPASTARIDGPHRRRASASEQRAALVGGEGGEAVEEVTVVLGAGRGLGVELDGKSGLGVARQALDATIRQVDV